MTTLKVAVVQATPVLFDLKKSLSIALEEIKRASDSGAELILFPESFLPGYPRGLDFGAVVGSRSDAGRKLWQNYAEAAVEVPGPITRRLAQAAKDAGAWLIMGITERASGSLYCSLLYFNPQGELVHKHRKIKPTAAERVIWGEGDGASLQCIPGPLGPMGGLICWENYMPLARLALYQDNIALYLAPTADQRGTWQASLRHIACEGRCFVLGCNQYVGQSNLPPDLHKHALADMTCRGGSVIISPMGEVLAGPLYDAPGILYAKLDLESLQAAKFDFDVSGHYSRPDLFEFRRRD